MKPTRLGLRPAEFGPQFAPTDMAVGRQRVSLFGFCLSFACIGECRCVTGRKDGTLAGCEECGDSSADSPGCWDCGTVMRKPACGYPANQSRGTRIRSWLKHWWSGRVIRSYRE